MIFNGNFEDDEKWAEGEARESKLVFIGKDLDHEGLKTGFAACATSPEILEQKKNGLRFKIGDLVECNTGGWNAGTVVDLMYRDEYMPPGMVAPYQVQLDKKGGEDGALIYAPADDSKVIRKETAAPPAAPK